MSDRLFTVKKFLQYFFSAKNAHGIHSPFVYKLYIEVINAKKKYYVFDEIESLRRNLLRNDTTMEVKDFGAGSRVDKSNIRKISSIARHALSEAKTGQMLFRLVDFLQPKNVLELGTSLGINALYLTKACSNSNVISLEGCPNTLNIAKENFQKLNAKVLTVIGEIGETLPKVLKEIEKLEFVFFDANHKKQPTLNYFNTCLPHINEHTVFIFDDIYWSKEMGEAWEQITHHPNVTLSIDLFDLGLVFFRKNQPKQHFLLRF